MSKRLYVWGVLILLVFTLPLSLFFPVVYAILASSGCTPENSNCYGAGLFGMLFMFGGLPIAFGFLLMLSGLLAYLRLSNTRMPPISGLLIPLLFVLNYKVFAGIEKEWFFNPGNYSLPLSNTVLLALAFMALAGVAFVPDKAQTSAG